MPGLILHRAITVVQLERELVTNQGRERIRENGFRIRKLLPVINSTLGSFGNLLVGSSKDPSEESFEETIGYQEQDDCDRTS